MSNVSFSSARISHDEIQFFAEVGKGAFGVIYRANWRGYDVAVKTMMHAQNDDMREKAFNEFRREVYVMSGMKHTNLVNLLGFCVDPFALVMEFVPGGNLYHYMRNLSLPMDWPLRLKIALDVAKGMHYLHDASPPFIHRDLKSPNILLVAADANAEVTAKVGDFGLSSRLFVPSLKEKSIDRDVANPTWLAPEILKEEEFTEKSDIYSFGIILWELVTRQHPFSEYNYQFMFELEDIIKTGGRPTIPADVPEDYAVLIRRCWSPDPTERPSFLEIIRCLVVLAAYLAPTLYIPDDVLQRSHQASLKMQLASAAAQLTSDDPDDVGAPVAASSSSDPQDNYVCAGQFLKQLRAPMTKSSIYSLLFCGGNQVWAGCRDGSVLVWNAENGLLIARHENVHKNQVSSMLAVGNRVWTHSWGEDIKVWKTLGEDQVQLMFVDAEKDLKDGWLHIKTSGIIGKVKRRFFKIRSKRLFVFKSDTDKSPAIMLDLVNGVELTDEKAPKKFQFELKPKGGKEKDKICVVCKDKEEQAAWVAAIHTEIERPEKALELELVSKIEAPDVNCLIVLDGLVWAGTTEMRLKVWDPNSFQLLKNVHIDISSLTEITSVMGLFICDILEYDHRIWLSVQKYLVCLDKESLIPLRVLDGHSLTINKAVGYDNKLWTCSDDCTIKVWDARTYECLQTFNQYGGKQFTLIRVGSQIWAAGWDGLVRVFSGRTCQLLKALEQKHQDAVSDFALSLGSVWASSWDGSITVWG
jgi:serine/threonine protein kinase